MTGMSDNMRGAALMVGSMAFFGFGDACIKALGGAMPLSQVLTIRGLAASVFIALMARAFGQLRFDMDRRDWGLVALRAVSEVGAAYFFLTALLNMPFANVTALLQMLPLTVTLASAVIFAEPVGWKRWSAIVIGFMGMLLIVRPGTEGFDAWSLYALVAVACVTVRDMSTRRMSRTVPSLTVTLMSSLAVLTFAAIWSLSQDWQPITATTGMLLAGASLFIVGGYSLSVFVMRVGEVSFVAPFRYTGLLWALLLGLVFFGEWPTLPTLVGAAIIMGTGIFTLLREARLKRRGQPAPNMRRT
ncbi:DMT family transporter [Citreimonas sp.]|uniref:DMT family transporter n=1 Tax=Citreimonas sp. TaxID=3036715 RepID=UPI0035C86969